MDIQFTLDEQSLQTLCFHYILNQSHKSKTIMINSILMQLVSNSKNKLIDIFGICNRIVEDNKSESTRSMTDKQYLKNMANLLKQISAKYPKLITLATEAQITTIIKFASSQVLCAVCGNDYIALIAMLCMKIKPFSPILQRIQEMLTSQKMHVGSYRQITRLHLYFLLMRVLEYKNQNQLDTQYLNKVIQLVEDEKDPRNISCVFQIYSTLLSRSKRQHVINIKKKLFDCLQMYYPIDFEGDADQHNIKLRDIAALLDQCLTNPIFVQQTRALLMIKMGAAPISKYITTFINTRNHPITQASTTFWTNLLKRTAEQQYMQEQYEEDAQHTLCDLIIQLLNRLIPVRSPISISSYTAVTDWLHSLIGKKIMDNDQNSKSAPFIITSLKDIMNKCNNQVRHLVGSYVIHSFITNYKNIGEIIYKLGILVPVLQSHHKNLDVQKTGLLILTLSQIFYQQHQQPQPKLIVLKLFMILANEPIYNKMITQTNIQLTCIDNIKNILSNNKIDEKNMRIVKAYIDFLVELYYNDAKVCHLIMESKRVEIWVYGLLTLANKNKQFYDKFLQMLQKGKDNLQSIYKQILGNLKQFKIQSVLEIVSRLPNYIDEYLSKQITQIICQKSTSLDINEQDMQEFLNKYLNQARMIYYLRNIWRPFLFKHQFLQYLSQKLKEQIKQQPGNKLCLTTIAFYNKSLQALNINLQAQITDESVINSEAYKRQLYKMLPIQKNHRYSAQQCISWPTLLHYAWSNSEQIRKDLIQYLPNSILTMEADRILPIILPTQDIQTLAKIMKNISQSTLVETIIPFVINFLAIIDQNTEVQKIVSLNSILFHLQAKSKQNKEIHSLLIKNKGKILVGIQEKLLQSRKRRARQSSRAIFSLYNAFK